MTRKQPSKRSLKEAEKRANNRARKMALNNTGLAPSNQQASESGKRLTNTANSFLYISKYLMLTIAIISTFSVVYSYSNNTLSTTEIIVYVLLNLILSVLIIKIISVSNRSSKIRTVMYTVSLISALIVGTLTQITINEKPVLKYSSQYDTYKLAVEILNDLRKIEKNQVFFTLPYSQTRGLYKELEAASKQSETIAQRWNPATSGDLPLPGFYDVYSLTNRVADIQAQALTLLLQDIKQEDASQKSKINEMVAIINDILLGSEGVAVKLSETVRTVGIKLKGDEKI